jgi:tryptophan synthase alpha chain
LGYGVSTPEQARDMADVSGGAIVNTAIVKIVAEYGREAAEPLRQYIRRLRDAL